MTSPPFQLREYQPDDENGLGQMLMQESEARLRRVGCPKINLQIRADNAEAIAFYETVGFKQDDVLSFGKRLVDDASAETNSRDKKPTS